MNHPNEQDYIDYSRISNGEPVDVMELNPAVLE